MHQAEAGPAHQDRAYEFVGCPMKAAADNSDIDPANMVSAAGLVCGAELVVEFDCLTIWHNTGCDLTQVLIMWLVCWKDRTAHSGKVFLVLQLGGVVQPNNQTKKMTTSVGVVS